MYKKTAQLSDLTYANLTQMSNQDSYNSLYRLKLSGQSDTSSILRWTGNSPIWGKITVPTRGSSTDDSPTHADLAYANLAKQVRLLQSYLPTQHRSPKRTINRMFDRYILLWHLEKSSLEHTRTDTANYTCDRNLTDILDAPTLSKWTRVQNQTNVYITVNK